MPKNIGNIDKILRLTVAIVLAALYFTGTLTGPAGIAALIVAAVMLLTSVISFCPLYKLVGMNTCGKCCAGACEKKE